MDKLHHNSKLIKPFTINVTEETLEDILARVRSFPWAIMAELDGWDHCTNLDYKEKFCNYWIGEYSWRQQEVAINRLNHFGAPVDSLNIHFIHKKGSGLSPMLLIISHGWPRIVLELLELVELLANPEHFGDQMEDAFDVIAPSSLGFGFSRNS